MPSSPVLSPIEYVCILHPHLLDLILHELSASSSAYLLAVLGLFENENWRRTREQFTSPLRDIPEHADEIFSATERGDTVLLVGQDLNRLRLRLIDPLLYWRSYPSGKAKDEKPLRIGLVFGTRPCSQSFIAWSISQDWEQSRFINESNIRIVCLTDCSAAHGNTPHLRLCPIQSELRNPDDMMGGFHECDDASPGALTSLSSPRRSKSRNVSACLPYLNLRSGKYGISDNLRKGSGWENILLYIEFYCAGSRRGVCNGRMRNIEIISPWHVILSSGPTQMQSG